MFMVGYPIGKSGPAFRHGSDNKLKANTFKQIRCTNTYLNDSDKRGSYNSILIPKDDSLADALI